MSEKLKGVFTSTTAIVGVRFRPQPVRDRPQLRPEARPLEAQPLKPSRERFFMRDGTEITDRVVVEESPNVAGEHVDVLPSKS